MSNYVQNLSSEEWSSEIDHIDISQASPYERKGYLNRYFLIASKAVVPYVRSRLDDDGSPITIIDAACGDGSGSAFLAEQFPDHQVVGVDLSETAIGLAMKNYGNNSSNLSFIHADILDLSDVRADIFVSMETLEHVDNDTMHKLLKGISEEILRPGGVFVASMPRLRPRESTKKRPGHINELYFDQFRHTMGEYFPSTEFYSLDRYANIVPETPDANLMVTICRKWPTTNIF